MYVSWKELTKSLLKNLVIISLLGRQVCLILEFVMRNKFYDIVGIFFGIFSFQWKQYWTANFVKIGMANLFQCWIYLGIFWSFHKQHLADDWKANACNTTQTSKKRLVKNFTHNLSSNVKPRFRRICHAQRMESVWNRELMETDKFCLLLRTVHSHT